jgi:hypothetical protein
VQGIQPLLPQGPVPAQPFIGPGELRKLMPHSALHVLKIS